MEPLYPFYIELPPIENVKTGLVSIITRTKNRPNLLKRALKSVKQQTYPHWEHIIVNDGGAKDDIDVVISTLPAEQIEKTKVIHLPQSIGMEGASNSGLALASGEFFIIHDDDDTWHEEFLSSTASFLLAPENEKLVAVATNCEVILEHEVNNQYIEKYRKDWHLWSKQIELQDLLTRNTIPTVSLLIRRRTLTQLKRYAEDMPVLGDWDFNIRLLLLGDIGTIDRPLAYYHQRINPTASASNSVSGGLERHHEYWQRYRNSLTRRSINEASHAIGLLNPILTKIDEIKQHQEADLQKIHTSLDGLHHALHRLEIFLSNSINQTRIQIQEEAKEIKRTIYNQPKAENSIKLIIRKLKNLMLKK